MKFRKKPVVIEAVKFNSIEVSDPVDKAFSEMPQWLEEAIDKGNVLLSEKTEDYFYCVIKTLEGEMTASPDDIITRGVNGEIYPCKPDIFVKTYEPL